MACVHGVAGPCEKCHAAEVQAAYRRGVEEAAALFDNCGNVMIAVEHISPKIRALSFDPCRRILKAHECVKPRGHKGLHVYKERVYG